MKNIIILIFFFISFNFAIEKVILLDKYKVRNYLLEIRQFNKDNKKKCYLYFFKKKDKDYLFYRAYDLLTENMCYFTGRYITEEKRYNKKGQYYFVKKKKEFKINFLDFDKTYTNMRRQVQKHYRRLVKDTIGVLEITGGKEQIANDKKVKEEYGRSGIYYKNGFYGDSGISIILLKNGEIGVYKGKRRGFGSHISYFSKQQYFEFIFDYGITSGKYPEIDFGYDPRDRFIYVCPQITPPQKYQKPMLNAKIKPYKNIAGNPIE